MVPTVCSSKDGGFLQQVPGVSIGERSLMVAVKNIARRLGDDISESKPLLDSRLPDGSRVAVIISPFSLGGVTHHSQVQHPSLRDGGFDSRWHSRSPPCKPSRRLRACTQEHTYQRRHGHGENHAFIYTRKIHSPGGTRLRYLRYDRDSTAAGKPHTV